MTSRHVNPDSPPSSEQGGIVALAMAGSCRDWLGLDEALSAGLSPRTRVREHHSSIGDKDLRLSDQGALKGTIGQPDAGPMSGGNFSRQAASGRA